MVAYIEIGRRIKWGGKYKMKKVFKKIIGILIVCGLILSGLPSQTAYAADTGVSFVLGTNGGSYSHIQTYGDTAGRITYMGGYPTLVLGTRGQAKRLEEIAVKLQNNTGYSGGITYQAYRQTYEWTDWVSDGQRAGTHGQAKRLEGIRIKLTGELAKHYDVRYRVHIQTYGDQQGWVYNGAYAGTRNLSKRLEELQVQIVPKESKNASTKEESVSYRVHRQTYGWEPLDVSDGTVSGTTGQAKRLEGIQISVSGKYSGSVKYQTQVQTYGWNGWKSDGLTAGTTGQAKRLEAIQMYLTGEVANYYDIYYRVHAQSYGWMNWAANGQKAGTTGLAKRLEAIQIVLVKKTDKAPGVTFNGVTSAVSACYVSLRSESNNVLTALGNHSVGSGTGDTVKGDTGKDNGNTGGTTDIPAPPVCDHDFSVVTLAGYKCSKCGEQKAYYHDWEVLYDGLKDKTTGDFYACSHSSWEVTSLGFRCKSCGGEIKCSGHNWVGQEPSENTGVTHEFCKYCDTDITKEGTTKSSHRCPSTGLSSTKGFETRYEHRTSAWACDGGCGVWISHWASEDAWDYSKTLKDKNGSSRTLILGVPDKTVLNGLEYKTIWR